MIKAKEIIDKLKKDKKLLIVIAIGLLGMIILVSGSMSEREKKSDLSDNAVPDSEKTLTASDIEEMLENKLTAIISDISGAGAVNVMVTVNSSGEYVYAENSKTKNGSDSSSSDSEIVIYESADKGDNGLVVSVKSPEILGVAVLCEGGESSVVKAEIVNLVTSLFGIGSDRVYVGKKAPK